MMSFDGPFALGEVIGYGLIGSWIHMVMGVMAPFGIGVRRWKDDDDDDDDVVIRGIYDGSGGDGVDVII
jgi:hypothetical protein